MEVPQYNFCQTHVTFVAAYLSAPKSVPVGVEDGKIPDGYITASSSWDKNHAPWCGRLNIVASARKKGAWSAKKNNRRQWLQVNMGQRTSIRRILTQGRQDYNQWVTSYIVFYSNNGVKFKPYRRKGRVQVRYHGNSRSLQMAAVVKLDDKINNKQ